MNLDQLLPFLDAMASKNVDAMLPHMADNITLKTPLVAEPFRGKAAVRGVAQALLAIVDRFELREILHGPEHVAQFFGVTIAGHQLDGLDYFRLDPNGFIQEMTVLWRPLPAMVAVDQLLNGSGPAPVA